MDIKAVAFDIDGTLYPNYLMFLLTFPSALRHPLLVWHFSRIRKKIRHVEYTGNFREKQAEMLAADMKISIEDAAEKLQKQLYDRWETAFRRLKPYKYAKEFIRTAKDRGLKTAALSDFPVGGKLEYLGMNLLFDIVISSEQTGYLKPSRVPFDSIAEKLGVPNNKILYIGNSYKYDIIGASEAGMKTAYLGPKKADNAADFVFSGYKDLEKQLFFTQQAG